MKKTIYIFAVALFWISRAFAQEYATFEITGIHQGKGSFSNAALSGFDWTVSGSLTGEVQILANEVFDDGNAFENTFGQADDAQNLRIQIAMNGSGTAGQPLTSSATMTLYFVQFTPPNAWGFCVVDIDVENCLISAIDENDNQVPASIINGWLVELFDANLGEDGINIPRWDSVHSAILGSDTPESYVTYNNLVIGGMPSSEAPAAYFMPDIRLKSLTIIFENLQDNYNTSYHFYIASLPNTGIDETGHYNFVIYPNPTRGQFKVQSSKSKVELQSLELIDFYGKLLETWNPDCELRTANCELNISHFPAGIYFVRLHIENQMIVKKIIKL